MLKTYQRKPYYIQAIEYTGENFEDVKKALEENAKNFMGAFKVHGVEGTEIGPSISIVTLDGCKIAEVGKDIILIEPKDGSVRVSRKDVFNQIYEEVKEHEE